MALGRDGDADAADDGPSALKGLLRLVFSRLLQGAALLLALSFVLFGVMAYLPGDPVDLLVASNPSLTPADVVRLKKLRGLDQPFPVRWCRRCSSTMEMAA